MCQRVALQPQYRAKAAWVAQAQGDIAEHQVDVIVFLRCRLGRYQPQAARHAQMDQQMAAAEIQQQVLAAPRDGAQTLADEGGALRMGQRITQRRHAKVGAGETAVEQRRRDAAPGDFDFRQFRHGENVAKLITSQHCMRRFYPGTLP